jgi:hypothetical protein
MLQAATVSPVRGEKPVAMCNRLCRLLSDPRMHVYLTGGVTVAAAKAIFRQEGWATEPLNRVLTLPPAAEDAVRRLGERFGARVRSGSLFALLALRIRALEPGAAVDGVAEVVTALHARGVDRRALALELRGACGRDFHQQLGLPQEGRTLVHSDLRDAVVAF